MIEGKNVLKNKLAKSVLMYLDWNYSAGDSMEVKFVAGKGTIKLPATWGTQIKYLDLKEDTIIEEDWKPTEIHLKYPSEHIISNGGSAINVLEMQIVHKLKKPAKE